MKTLDFILRLLKRIRISWLVIAVLLVIIFFLRECNSPKCPDIKTITDTIKGDSVPVIRQIKQPYPVFTKLPPDTFWMRHIIDTSFMLFQCRQIAKEFYAQHIFVDTLQNDTSALIVLMDSIYKNALHGRSLAFQNRRATIINTTQVITPAEEKAKLKLFVGFDIAGGIDLNGRIGPQVALLTKRDHLYMVGNNLIAKQPNLSLTILWKLGFKKHTPY